MGKRLASVLAFLAMWIPVAGYALGLGNISMKSALNQPLDAEVALLDVRKGDLENLKAKLGSQKDFDRVSAERNFFLTKLNFNIETRPDGSAYIKVSSTQAVVEPFLDFVIEVRWPRGRILREFTVLVDPPVLVNEAPAPVQRAQLSPQPVTPQRGAPRAEERPVVRSINDEEFFRSRSLSGNSSVAREPIAERAQLTPITSAEGELAYGPLKRRDTLWTIAERMRPADVDMNQMMVALVRQNPQAFYHGNVNEMKAGYVLRITDEDAMSALAAAEARAEVRRQHNEWQARKNSNLMAQTEAPVSGEIQRGKDAGVMQASAASEDQASLKLVAPGSEGAGSGAAGGENVDQLREDLLLATEALDANFQETQELKARLKQMEEQLASMQRLISLKDNEMAGLQQQLSGDEEPAETMAEPAMAEISVADSAELGMTAAQMENIEAPATPVPAPKPVAPPASTFVAMELVDEILAQVMAVVDDPSSLLENRKLLYGLMGLVVILLLSLMIVRRRSMQASFEESILNVGNSTADSVETESMPSISESTMVNDLAMGEMGDISGFEADASDVDPISEADVYLAYGRHQQAEDIIREAMRVTPERNELKAKMLEVYFAAKKREAFEEQAQELHDALGDESDPLWARAVTMGYQLCPGNELFGGVSADTLKEELASGVDASDEDLLDLDFDMDSPDLDDGSISDDISSEIDAAVTETADITGALDDEADTALDFNVSFDEKADDDSSGFDVSDLNFDLDDDETETAVGEAEDLGLEFTLDDAEPPTVETLSETLSETTEESLSEDAAALEDVDVGLEFDIGDLDTVETGELGVSDTADLGVATSGLDDADTADSEMDIDDISLEESADTSPELEDLEIGDPSVDDLNVDELSAEDSAATGLEANVDELDESPDAGMAEVLGDELGEDVFSEIDEVGTKLDLARAYVDMGDENGARNILSEVLEEGNDEQKAQAQELLSQMA